MRHDITKEQVKAVLGERARDVLMYSELDETLDPRAADSWCLFCFRGTKYPAYHILMSDSQIWMADLEALSELFESKLINIVYTREHPDYSEVTPGDPSKFVICIHGRVHERPRTKP